jgi:hypothetical protein
MRPRSQPIIQTLYSALARAAGLFEGTLRCYSNRRMRCVTWLAISIALTSCGGSSSETPPPLEPDPQLRRYTGPQLPPSSLRNRAVNASGNEALGAEQVPAPRAPASSVPVEGAAPPSAPDPR